MNRPVGEAIRKWRAYFSAYAALPGALRFLAAQSGYLGSLTRPRQASAAT
jgi:hypothetical protein